MRAKCRVGRVAPDRAKYRARRAADKRMKRHKNLYCAVTNRCLQRRRASLFRGAGRGS
ncbi:hypothetical protein OH687_35705 [Burkholderia anthina]|nr:hypothetical protein OH687_35705 [Burkholderia anthina]